MNRSPERNSMASFPTKLLRMRLVRPAAEWEVHR